MKIIHTFFCGILLATSVLCNAGVLDAARKISSVSIGEEKCSQVIGINEGANNAEGVILTSSIEGNSNKHFEVFKFTFSGKKLISNKILLFQQASDIRDIVGLKTDSYVSLMRTTNKEFSLYKAIENSKEIKQTLVPQEFLPIGIVRLSTISFAIYGSIESKPALLYYDDNLLLIRKVIFDEFPNGSVVFGIAKFSQGDLLLTIYSKSLLSMGSKLDISLIKINDSGKVKNKIKLDPEVQDIYVSINQSNEILYTYYEVINEKTSAIAIKLTPELSLKWKSNLYIPFLSVARISSLPIGANWIIFGSNAFKPTMYELSESGALTYSSKSNDAFAAPSIAILPKLLGRSFATVQDNIKIQSNNPTVFERCNGVRIDYWDLKL